VIGAGQRYRLIAFVAAPIGRTDLMTILCLKMVQELTWMALDGGIVMAITHLLYRMSRTIILRQMSQAKASSGSR